MSDQGTPAKVCINCHRDCADRPRVKDRAGRYICRECLNQMKTTGQTLPPPKPARAAAAATAARSDRDIMMSLVDDAVSRQPESCPQCGVPAQKGAVLCVHCGYNRETGRAVRTRVEKAKAEKLPKEKRRVGGGSSDAGALVAAGLSLAVFGVIFAVAFTNEEAAMGYLLLQSLFGLVISIVVLVAAFMEDAATGFLTLCVPFYILYFVFGKCENAYIKLLFAVNIFANIGSIFLQMNMEGGF